MRACRRVKRSQQNLSRADSIESCPPNWGRTGGRRHASRPSSVHRTALACVHDRPDRQRRRSSVPATANTGAIAAIGLERARGPEDPPQAGRLVGPVGLGDPAVQLGHPDLRLHGALPHDRHLHRPGDRRARLRQRDVRARALPAVGQLRLGDLRRRPAHRRARPGHGSASGRLRTTQVLARRSTPAASSP